MDIRAGFFLLFFSIFFGGFLILDSHSISDEIQSPVQQLKNGVLPEDVVCRDGLELIFKNSDDSPVCVKPTSVSRLIEIGWAYEPERTGTWNPQTVDYYEDSFPYGSPSVPSTSAGTPSLQENIGFATGGAKDIENFRKNIENDYLPLFSDITYEGLFYDYFFDTGQKEECEKLFCPSYSYAISKDPLSLNDEYYLSVGLNSGIKEADFERKTLNLVIVLDVSGSMGSPFSKYYYDQFGNEFVREDYSDDDLKTKMTLASESVAGLIDHLDDNDRLGIVLFDDHAHLAKPLESMKITNKEVLKQNILQIFEFGGTNMEVGMKMGTTLFNEVIDSDKTEFENRIIFLTDAMPNLGDTSEEGLFGMMKKNADDGIYTTFIGIGVDFNTELVESITKVRGANYYSVHSANEFKERMVDEFEFMVTPLVFNLVLSLETDGFDIKQVYGSPEANEATGEIMKVNTLFPSKAVDGKVKGGIILLKLEKTSPDGNLVLKTSYENRVGQTDGQEIVVELEDQESEFFDNTGIRKGVLLSRYAELMKTWAFDERKAYVEKNPVTSPMIFYEDGIHLPDYVSELGEWEQQSIPLQVSDEYKVVIKDFNDYFKTEIIAIDDPELNQEVTIMKKLVDLTN